MTLTNIGSRKLLIKGSFTPRTDPEGINGLPSEVTRIDKLSVCKIVARLLIVSIA